MTFIKNTEDFVCENCGTEVHGNGYTNHCPQCLYSKHVDNDPGDRANPCHGLMVPVRIEGTADAYRIVHRCVKCSFEKRNDVAAEDSMEAVVQIARNGAA